MNKDKWVIFSRLRIIVWNIGHFEGGEKRNLALAFSPLSRHVETEKIEGIEIIYNVYWTVFLTSVQENKCYSPSQYQYTDKLHTSVN